MNLKSLIAGILITTIGTSAFAQKGEVFTAKENIQKYLQMARSTPKLAAPFQKTTKESIEKAIVHEKTKADPELWSMRAALYAEMAFNDSTSAANKYIAEAKASLTKLKELDPAADNREQVKTAKFTLYQKQLVDGKKLYDAKKYAEAHKAFNQGLEFSPGDTLSNFYAGVSAQQVKNYPAAIKNYTDILNTNFSYMPDVYTNLGETYAANQDTAAAIRILAEGYSKFPKNHALVAREIGLSVNSGRYKEVVSKIETQMQHEPTNRLYPFYLGIAYSGINELTKAEEAYKKAIAIDPKFIEAYLNIGTIIMNKGIDTYNAANKKYSGKSLNQTQLAEYNAVKKKAIAEFDRALPYLNKIVELNPKSRDGWNNLRTYYSAKSNTAKVAEIDATLKGL